MNKKKPFSDRITAKINEKESVVVVGLDPEYLRIPFCFRDKYLALHGNTLKAAAESIIAFNRCIIDAVAPLVPIVKPQIAFYEMYGLEGLRAFENTINYAKQKGLIVIEDAKRNDIGNTARAYSRGHMGKAKLLEGLDQTVFDVDAITVNPYLGYDGIDPFLEDVSGYGKGIFVLVKTSNPSSSEIQDLVLKEGGVKLYEHLAKMVDSWGRNYLGSGGYSSVGAVVGATFPAHAKILRKLMPHSIFLVPGYGAQGGTARDVMACFNEDGYGAIISASRSINYPHLDNLKIPESLFKEMVKSAVDNMNNDINSALKNINILPW
jgi:orotidine-5'-phosphate decarboxylase